MTTSDPASIRPATTADVALIRGWLEADSLPVADVTTSAAIEFLVALEGGEPVGAVGLERFGSTGLLRSLVVAAPHRGAGHGTALVEALERRAAESGIERLALLTTTAAGFFAARGYAVTDRAALPDALLASREFSALCPASATCLARRLHAPG
jgi:amino-acid N-acetyltransferase